MKKLYFLLFSTTLIATLAKTQNTFPASGNVGVGTLSPADKLTVITRTAFAGITHSDGTIKVGTYVGGGAGYYGTISNHPLYLRTNNGAAQVALLQNGRFGIGTTAPMGKLDVTGGDAYIQTVRVGIGAANIVTNTCVGRLVFNTNTTGSANTAIGYSTLYSNTTGAQNTATGNLALYKNKTGSGNIAIGSRSLYNNTTGYSNLAIGVAALYSNTVHSNLVAIGDSALFSTGATGLTFGNDADFNTAIGSKALFANTAGSRNTAVGFNSLYSNKNGVVNTAVGYKCLYKNTSGIFNVAVGDEALASNTAENANTAIGSGALKLSTGYENTGVGSFVMQSNTTGNSNTACGENALGSNTTGSSNTGLGWAALSSNQDGNYNTAIGYAANVGYAGIGGQYSYTNSTALGANAACFADNIVRIGDADVTSIGGWVNWTNVSDGRVKKNIRPNVPGLAFINKLLPVTYNLDLAAADKITQVRLLKDRDPKMEKFRADKEASVYTGFVAQDVEKAANELNYHFSGVDVAKNDHDLYGLRYAEFVVPLVKSVQELSKKNDELQSQVDTLKATIESINRKLAGNVTSAPQNINLSLASLQQNLPNPFNNSTDISYVLPLTNVSAKIVITDKGGKTLKKVDISGSGKGKVSVNTAAISAGTYQYSLYVNDHLIETRQMVLSR